MSDVSGIYILLRLLLYACTKDVLRRLDLINAKMYRGNTVAKVDKRPMFPRLIENNYSDHSEAAGGWPPSVNSFDNCSASSVDSEARFGKDKECFNCLRRTDDDSSYCGNGVQYRWVMS